MSEPIKIISSRVLSAGWSTLKEYDVDFTRADGSVQRLTREAYDHGHAAAILLHDPMRDMVLLVRQFRFAAHMAGGPSYLAEVVAGLLEGDAPEVCARREAEEEAGVAVKDCVPAFTVFISPGSITEKIHCFIGTYDGPVGVKAGLGLEEEGEDIEVVELAFDKAFGMIASGEILDLKTVVLLQHLMLQRRV